MSSRFVCIEVRPGSRECAERVVAEAAEAGAAGSEERGEGEDTCILLYAERSCADAVRQAAVAAAGPAAVAPPADVPQRDWVGEWRDALVAVEVSPRLVVRPPSVEATGRPEVLIEPKQAFGAGGHESTRLALEWIDAWSVDRPPGARVLDIGTGSGVLALAALRLGAARALALDLDPVATREARENARANGLAARLALVTAAPDALAPGAFDLVTANLLCSELVPCLPQIARQLSAPGRAVLSGLLADELTALGPRLREAGLRVVGERRRHDASGVEWLALLASRDDGAEAT